MKAKLALYGIAILFTSCTVQRPVIKQQRRVNWVNVAVLGCATVFVASLKFKTN